jgi:hypothetical protein
MIKRLVILIIFIIFLNVLPVYSEFEDKNAGVRASAMGGAYTALCDDGEAVFYNPAGIARNSFLAELSSMHTSLYGQDDLSLDYVAFSQPMMPFAVLQMTMLNFGGELYKEKTTMLSIARKITDRYMLGISFKYLRTEIAQTPDASAFSGDIGFIVNFSDNFSGGFSIIDFNNPKVNDLIPRTTKAGVSFKPIDPLTISLDYTKRRDEDEGTFSLGEEFKVNEHFFLRAGYISRPSRITAGFGFHIASLKINYAFRNHEELDNTHRISASLTF